jgi:hypothetical protein
MKSNIIYKKTFWMNVGLSIFSILGCLVYVFFLMGIEVVNKFEVVFDFFFLVTPILTVITFYKNEKGLINTISLVLNSIVLVIYSMFVLRIGHISVDSLLSLLIWSIPFIINVKQLRELRSV